MIINSTLINHNNDLYYDNFPLSYEDNNLINGTYYDDYVLNNTQIYNIKNSNILSLSFSSPFSFIFLILIIYLFLTFILFSFSLYKQRQNEIENFYFGDTEEDIKKEKNFFLWKQLLIGKITKGDMEPLLNEINNQQENFHSKTMTFPLNIV